MNEEKYKRIYRIPSVRRRDWDYGANAACFVTICTAGGEHFFGEIVCDDGDGDPVETRCIASVRRVCRDAMRRICTPNGSEKSYSESSNFLPYENLFSPVGNLIFSREKIYFLTYENSCVFRYAMHRRILPYRRDESRLYSKKTATKNNNQIIH